MTAPRPDWLAPLGEPPALDAAMAGLRASLAGAVPPVDLCRQCFEDYRPTLRADLRAMAGGKRLPPERYTAVFFEHPNCVGGPDTLRIVLPWALEDTWLPGPEPQPRWISDIDVVEGILKAGLWYWPADQLDALRAVAGRLYLDWVRDGRCAFAADAPSDLRAAVADDILSLALAALIDPVDLVRAAMENAARVEAMEVLTLCLSPPLEAPFYVAADIAVHPERPYEEACARIAAMLRGRLAEAVDAAMPLDWTDAAFLRWEALEPEIGLSLSDRGRDLACGDGPDTGETAPLGPKPALATIEAG